MKARAIEFVGPSVVRVIDVDVPAPGPGDVVVRTLYSGISAGTETLAFKGRIPEDVLLDESIGSLAGTFSFPFRYGYSCAGVVEEGSDELETGRLVFCLHPHQSKLVRPHDEFIPVDDVDPRVATLLPIVETGLQISLDAGDPDGPVLVFGLGAVGILAAASMNRRGIDVTGVEPLAERRNVASRFGLRAIPPEEVRDGVAMVVECSGRPDVLAGALDLLDHEGTALVASWYGDKPVELPLGGAFHRRRLTIRSTQVSSIPRHLQEEWTFERRTQTAVSMLKGLPVELLATHTFQLSEAQAAFEAAAAQADGLIHAALSYD